VAAGDLDARGTQGIGGKVEHGRGGQADVNDLDTRFSQAAHQGRAQLRPAQATVTTHGHCRLPFAQGQRAKGPAQRLRHRRVDGAGHDTADVIGLENGSCQLHRVSLSVLMDQSWPEL